jgi:predicted MFS family arabinose efflux permease
MARLASALAAAIGLTVGIAAALLAQLVPPAANLRFLGVCILGMLISMSACQRR